jgi:NADPH2:quinone reductase
MDTHMRAVIYRRTGDPDVLELVELPVPQPGPGEVRVRIHRSGVNPTDWKVRRGTQPGTPVNPPQVPHHDGAGVVDAVGPGVEQAFVGLRVWVWEAAHGRPYGTAADYSLVPRRHVVTLPDSASFDLGASLGVPYITAHRCLTVAETGPSRLGPGALEGRTVLVAGGAGAVGHAAIQLARWSDATVITTVSGPEKGQLAAAAGADHIIDYKRQNVAREVRGMYPHGVDTIVEVAPAHNAEIDSQILAANGVVAAYASDGADVSIPIRPSMQVNARWQFVLLYTMLPGPKANAVEDVDAAVLDGAVAVGEAAGLPLHHFPLERAADAHAAVERGVVGKVLIDVADE